MTYNDQFLMFKCRLVFKLRQTTLHDFLKQEISKLLLTSAYFLPQLFQAPLLYLLTWQSSTSRQLGKGCSNTLNFKIKNHNLSKIVYFKVFETVDEIK